jgi:hypothetical protein
VNLVGFPTAFERAETQLVLVVESAFVDAAHVLLAVRADEVVVGLPRPPPVDDEVAMRDLEVPEQFGTDVTVPSLEERRPGTLRPVFLLELGRLADVVAEDERDQRRPPRSWWAAKKFSLPAVAIDADALSSRQSAAAATICANR